MRPCTICPSNKIEKCLPLLPPTPSRIPFGKGMAFVWVSFGGRSKRRKLHFPTSPHTLVNLVTCTVSDGRLARASRKVVGLCAQTDVKINKNNMCRHRVTKQSKAREQRNTETVRSYENSSNTVEALSRRIRGPVLTSGLDFYTWTKT